MPPSFQQLQQRLRQKWLDLTLDGKLTRNRFIDHLETTSSPRAIEALWNRYRADQGSIDASDPAQITNPEKGLVIVIEHGAAWDQKLAQQVIRILQKHKKRPFRWDYLNAMAANPHLTEPAVDVLVQAIEKELPPRISGEAKGRYRAVQTLAKKGHLDEEHPFAQKLRQRFLDQNMPKPELRNTVLKLNLVSIQEVRGQLQKLRGPSPGRSDNRIQKSTTDMDHQASMHFQAYLCYLCNKGPLQDLPHLWQELRDQNPRRALEIFEAWPPHRAQQLNQKDFAPLLTHEHTTVRQQALRATRRLNSTTTSQEAPQTEKPNLADRENKYR